MKSRELGGTLSFFLESFIAKAEALKTGGFLRFTFLAWYAACDSKGVCKIQDNN